MEPVNITFLGTSNSIPTEKRNHSAILVVYKDENILVDCGEGTQRQFKIANQNMNRLSRILITHWHGDHTLGLGGLFQTLSMNNYTRTLKVYGPRGTKNFIELIKKFVANFTLNLEVTEVSEGVIIDEKDFQVISEPMKHGGPTNAYSIVIKDRIRINKDKLNKLKLPPSPLLKQLQEGKDITINKKKIKAKSITYREKGKKLAIILDTAPNSNALSLAKGADILISEASFAEEESERAKEYKHMTAKDAASLAKKAKAKRLILTHISQRYEHMPEIIEKEAKKVFKNVVLAKDFDSFVI